MKENIPCKNRSSNSGTFDAILVYLEFDRVIDLGNKSTRVLSEQWREIGGTFFENLLYSNFLNSNTFNTIFLTVFTSSPDLMSSLYESLTFGIINFSFFLTSRFRIVGYFSIIYSEISSSGSFGTQI